MQFSRRAVFFTGAAVLTLVCLFAGFWNDKGQVGSRFPIRHLLNTIDIVIPSPETPKKMMNEDRMWERISVKDMACTKLKGNKQVNITERKPTKYSPIILYTAAHNLSYCGVGKAGGTLIKQFFSLLVKGENQTRRYENISRLSIHREMGKYGVKFHTKGWKHARILTVGRNPYTRLFSAFVDRVYVPSTTKSVRGGALCRYDVTFEEFLKIVIDNTKHGLLDPHWSPIYDICHPCSVSSTFIVKQESFTDDLQFVAKALELPVATRADLLRKLTEDRGAWTIKTVVKEQMSTARSLVTGSQCIGWFGAIKRIWKSMQIQGHIPENIDLPVQLYNETNDFSNTDLILKTIFKTINQYPLSREEMKGQRHRHLVNAYSVVDKKVIDGIKRTFKPDFDMFGYSDEPPM